MPGSIRPWQRPLGAQPDLLDQGDGVARNRAKTHDHFAWALARSPRTWRREGSFTHRRLDGRRSAGPPRRRTRSVRVRMLLRVGFAAYGIERPRPPAARLKHCRVMASPALAAEAQHERRKAERSECVQRVQQVVHARRGYQRGVNAGLLTASVSETTPRTCACWRSRSSDILRRRVRSNLLRVSAMVMVARIVSQTFLCQPEHPTGNHTKSPGWAFLAADCNSSLLRLTVRCANPNRISNFSKSSSYCLSENR